MPQCVYGAMAIWYDGCMLSWCHDVMVWCLHGEMLQCCSMVYWTKNICAMDVQCDGCVLRSLDTLGVDVKLAAQKHC